MNNRLTGQPDFTPIDSIQWDSSWPELVSADEQHDLLSGLEYRFGIPVSVFDDYLLFKKKSTCWLYKGSESIVPASGLKVWKVGFKAFQKIGSFVKPSTRLIQQFGKYAVRSVIEIDNNALDLFLNGDYLPVETELDNGYIILSINKVILGLGLLVDGSVRSQIPKKELRIWS